MARADGMYPHYPAASLAVGRVSRGTSVPLTLQARPDSLSMQQVDTIDNLLRIPGGPVVNEFSVLNRSISLDPNHPDSIQLIEEAGVSLDRLSQPLVSYWRIKLLANAEELHHIFEGVNNFKLKVHKSDIAIDWPTRLLEMWAHVPKRRTYAPGVFEEPSVVMVEAGAHWNPTELGCLLTDQEMIMGWYAMVSIYRLRAFNRHTDGCPCFMPQVQMMEYKLRNLQVPVSLFWRTVSPAHIDCAVYTERESLCKPS